MRRMIEEERDDFTLRLLASAEVDDEDMPSGALERAALAVGVSTTSVTIAAGALAAKSLAAKSLAAKSLATNLSTALVAAESTTGVVAAAAGSTSTAILVKFGIFGAIAGTVLSAGGAAMLVPSRPREPSASSISAAPVVSAQAAPRNQTRQEPPQRDARVPSTSASERARAFSAARSAQTPAELSESGPTDGQGPVASFSAISAPSGAGARATAPPDTTRDASRLAEELAMLDGARAELRRGNASQALRHLDGYSRSHPGGALTAEASVLRVEALVRLERNAEAAALAQQILSASGEGHRQPWLRAVAEGR